jgi:ATP phosphoribosyltransferase-like protein
MNDPARKQTIEGLVVGLKSVLEARTRVMVELNVGSDSFDRLIAVLPSMREPTVSSLHGGSGLAVKAAVPRSALPDLIPTLKEAGATDIVVSKLEQIVP